MSKMSARTLGTGDAGTMKLFGSEVKRSYVVHPLLILVQICFAIWPCVGKIVMSDYNIHPLVFALAREIYAGVLLAMLAWSVDGFRKPQLKHIPLILAVGFVGVYLNQLWYILGLKATSPTTAALWQPVIPVFATALAIALKFEIFRWLKLGGIVLSASGAMFITIAVSYIKSQEGSSSDSGKTSSELVIGNVMLLMQVCSVAAQVLIQKKALVHYPPFTVTFWGYIVCTTVMFFTNIIYFGTFPTNEFAKFNSGPAFAGLSFSVIIATCLTYTALSWCNKYAPVSIVTVYMSVQPIFTAVISHFFLHEKLYLVQLLGGLAIVGGLCLVCYSKYRDSVTDKYTKLASNEPGLATPNSTGTPLDPLSDSSSNTYKVPLLGAEFDDHSTGGPNRY